VLASFVHAAFALAEANHQLPELFRLAD